MLKKKRGNFLKKKCGCIMYGSHVCSHVCIAARAHTYTQPLDTDDDMTQKMSRDQKQMQKLMKKLRKDAQQDAGKKQRWVDDTVHGRPGAEDLLALELFRDMKRREF